MDRVFPKNLDPVDRDDEKKAIGMLEDYIRYMKEQIEWAMGVILRLQGGTSLAKLAMDMDALQSGISSLQRDGVDNHNRILTLQGIIDSMNLRLQSLEYTAVRKQITTTVTSASTDDEIPTAKAVYDAMQ